MIYAINELSALMKHVSAHIADIDETHADRTKLWYIASLVSELCYYHVPPMETGNDYRTRIVPHVGYRSIVTRGQSTDVRAALRGLGFDDIVIIEDRCIVSVGIVFNDMLVIGFRGTKFAYDWSLNMSSGLANISGGFFLADGVVRGISGGRIHQGYLEEASRVSQRILSIYKNFRTSRKISHVVVCGHSLGGAVAAISGRLLLGISDTQHSIIFGSPRCFDAIAMHDRLSSYLVHISRKGDMVPCLPSKMQGYADYPIEYDTSGDKSYNRFTLSSCETLMAWIRFLFRCAADHGAERYRMDIGRLCSATCASQPLIDETLLKTNF